MRLDGLRQHAAAMTETASAPPYSSPRLERPEDGRVLGGVCEGLARTTGTTVVLWRVLFVAALVFGGAGLLLYLLGVVLIPSAGQDRSLAERVLQGPDRRLELRQALLLVALAVVLTMTLSDSDSVLVVVALAALFALWWRGQHGPRADVAPTADPLVTAAAPPAPLPPQPPAPPRPRSPLGRLTVSAVVLLLGVLALLDATGAADVQPEVALAAALLLVGAGLVAGSFFGGSPGLVVLAVLLALGLGATSAVRPTLEAGVGERTWKPTGAADYRLGAGEATLDLRDVPTEGDAVDVTARLTFGHLVVLVPDDLRVELDASLDVGDVRLIGRDLDDHRDVHERTTLGPPEARVVNLDASLRAGQIEVRYV